MNWTDWDKAVMALMMWREYRSGGREKMRPCGHVAMNRAQREKRPIHRIITDDAQFTSINPPGKTYDPQLDVWPRRPDSRFDDAMELAEAILSEVDDDPTNGATFYWNPATATEGGWFDRNIAPKQLPYAPRPGYEVAATIGAHIFYREKAV